MLQVIAELHVEVSVEECLRLARLRGHGEAFHVTEHADGRFAEHPALRVVAWHDPHADAEVAISGTFLGSIRR